MFGLFKKKNDNPAPKANQPDPKKDQEAELERQRKLVQMQKTLEEMREKIDIGYKKLDEKQNKIKDLIRQKRKAEAKRQLQVFKTFQEELAKQENMCIILEKTKIQLEVAAETSKMVEVFKDAMSLQKEVEKNVDFLQDFLLDKKEMDEQNKQVGDLLSEIAAGDEQEIEDVERMYKELEGEIMDEKLDDINADPLINAKQPIKEKVNPQISTTTVSSKQEEASLDDLLSQAANYN
jgi:Snf7.